MVKICWQPPWLCISVLSSTRTVLPKCLSNLQSSQGEPDFKYMQGIFFSSQDKNDTDSFYIFERIRSIPRISRSAIIFSVYLPLSDVACFS
uniref:Uncharacterized protein n=1 Tax=Aegilops tauschii subsp. strangulata TaxID=200361 RepID=A0A453EQ76_AEGTS